MFGMEIRLNEQYIAKKGQYKIEDLIATIDRLFNHYKKKKKDLCIIQEIIIRMIMVSFLLHTLFFIEIAGLWKILPFGTFQKMMIIKTKKMVSIILII